MSGGDNYTLGVLQFRIEHELGLTDGVGLAQLPRAYVANAIAEGRLVSLLDDWQPSGAPFALYYSSRRQMPAALQALVDFLRQNQSRAKASR